MLSVKGNQLNSINRAKLQMLPFMFYYMPDLYCMFYMLHISVCYSLIDAHCERLPDDPAQGLLFESESESKYIPFFENVTVACHEVGRPLRSTLTAGFRQCVFDPREGLPQQHWLSGARPVCPSMH